GLAIVQIGIGRGRGVERPSASACTEPATAPAAPTTPAAPAAAPVPAATATAPRPRRPDPKAADGDAPPTSTLTVKQPVRGGQVIYAARGDLVVLAPVNAGAQVIADGHV